MTVDVNKLRDNLRDYYRTAIVAFMRLLAFHKRLITKKMKGGFYCGRKSVRSLLLRKRILGRN